MNISARQCAAKILLKIERADAYSNLALDAALRTAALSAKDTAFVSALVMGVLERRLTLDYNLSLYLKKDGRKLKPEALTILRVGAFQILFMEGVPARAAVSESVVMARQTVPYAAGLINAVLRRVAENGLVLPEEDSPEYASVRYAVPVPLYRLFCDSVGETAAARYLLSTFGSPSTVVRVNTLKTDAAGLVTAFLSEGVIAAPHPLLENALTVSGAGNITRLSAFKDGLFHVQDASSQLCVKALSACPGDTVFDMCAAPGGKSLTIAQYLEGKGKLYSFDLTENRLSLIINGAKRLGITDMDCRQNDASLFNPTLPAADAVLCDVPCSGLGIINKKPEIRYKQVADFERLPELQHAILSAGSRYVKSGGTLLYSTCTLNSSENAGVVHRFLSENKSFHSEKIFPEIERVIDDGDFLTLLPPEHPCDGFFIAKLKKE